MKTLINDDTLRESLSRKAKERAKMFSIDNTIRAYEWHFEKALRRHTGVLNEAI